MDKETNKTNNQSLKIQLSLASLMFFSPFIIHLLKNDNFELDKNEHNFIEWYISLWWINIFLLILALASWLVSYYYNIVFLNIAYQIIVWILITILAIWSIWAITEINIISKSRVTKYSLNGYNNTNKIQLLLSYIPIYNIYLRYKKHNFENPDLLIKESIIMWTFFGITCLIPIQFFAIIVWIIIITRIVSLIWDINIVPETISDFISSLFYKNIEEVWSYIWAVILFILHWNYNRPYLKLLIEDTKKEYQYLYDIKKFSAIQWQYILMIISIIIVLRQIDLWNISWLIILTILLAFWRYGIMIYIWWRSPAIPIAREITSLFSIILKPFISKK